MNPLIFLFAVLFVFTTGGELKAAPEDSGTDARTYDAHGIIRQIAADGRAVTIQHDAIAGYMPAMTMEFPIKNTNELHGISPSDEITFKLAVQENGDWVEDVRFVAHRIESVTNGVVTIHVPTAELRAGDLLPDYELTTETGDKIHISDFRGRVLAFTFFFHALSAAGFLPAHEQGFCRDAPVAFENARRPDQLAVSFHFL